jgi:hypothetical protein
MRMAQYQEVGGSFYALRLKRALSVQFFMSCQFLSYPYVRSHLFTEFFSCCILRLSIPLPLQLPVAIVPTMVYNLQDYSGLMWQFVCLKRAKNRKVQNVTHILAAGGRYSNLINRMRQVIFSNVFSKSLGVGIEFRIIILVLFPIYFLFFFFI